MDPIVLIVTQIFYFKMAQLNLVFQVAVKDITFLEQQTEVAFHALLQIAVCVLLIFVVNASLVNIWTYLPTPLVMLQFQAIITL